MAPTDAMTIARLTAERDDAVQRADRWADLAEKAGAALKGADAEIARLRAHAALPRWWCLMCEHINVGGDACATCRRAKPVQPTRHA